MPRHDSTTRRKTRAERRRSQRYSEKAKVRYAQRAELKAWRDKRDRQRRNREDVAQFVERQRNWTPRPGSDAERAA